MLGSNDLTDFNIITKMPAIKDSQLSLSSLEEWLDASFSESLCSLGIDHVQGLLVHNCDDLFTQSGPAISRFLYKLKSLGRCSQIGVSVYSSMQVKKFLDLFTPDIIQLPFNVFDQRLLIDGTLSSLKELNIEIHARSIFLQGLLLMRGENIPSYFKPWMSQLFLWNKICADMELSPQHAALDYVISNDYIDQVIVGVESLGQLVDLASTPFGNDLSLIRFRLPILRY